MKSIVWNGNTLKSPQHNEGEPFWWLKVGLVVGDGTKKTMITENEIVRIWIDQLDLCPQPFTLYLIENCDQFTIAIVFVWFVSIDIPNTFLRAYHQVIHTHTHNQDRSCVYNRDRNRKIGIELFRDK